MSQYTRVTDGRTDGQTEFSSLYRVCIKCSAVKILRAMRTATVIGTVRRTAEPARCAARGWSYQARWSIALHVVDAGTAVERTFCGVHAADVVGAHCLLSSTADQIITSPFAPSFVQNVYCNISASRTVVCCADNQRIRTFCWHVTDN